ncbi:MAG: PstS family phosphate ABC transporter substrate-binding protein [Alphaproteobacteria bacterium]|nr:PstS family phosphate ABC transporter substrate-binding protein [Alphaproteobacteria bacterium]
MRKLLLAAAIAAIGIGTALAADTRNQIRIVGSSTVFPFSTAVAEEFGKTTNFKTPVVESTGSGGGLKLFCAGIGLGHPDITNASRRIKDSEVAICAKNGVSSITEVKVGFDGIVLANSTKAKRFELTRKAIWLALAKDVPDASGNFIPNPNKTWKDVDASLPAVKIEVLGPPPTSGTRDAFVELAMEGGCKAFPDIKAMKKTDKSKYKAICHAIREDGAFIDAGENDNLIVQKLEANPDALGVFGFSFLDQNRDKVQGSIVDKVEPSFDNISGGQYPVSRSLYFYVKNAHVGVVPGIKEFIDAFTSETAWGPYGYLADRGLIPLPVDERDKIRSAAMSLMPYAK